jgi:hypothetical protein
MAFEQHFGALHQSYLMKGQEYRSLFVSSVEEFFEDQEQTNYTRIRQCLTIFFK